MRAYQSSQTPEKVNKLGEKRSDTPDILVAEEFAMTRINYISTVPRVIPFPEQLLQRANSCNGLAGDIFFLLKIPVRLPVPLASLSNQSGYRSL